MTIFHPKFLHGVCIRIHSSNLGTYTGGVTTLLPPLHTTVVTIIGNKVQKVGVCVDLCDDVGVLPLGSILHSHRNTLPPTPPLVVGRPPPPG